MSLQSSCFRKVGEEFLAFQSRRHQAETPPYIVYVYPPKEEFKVRRDLLDFRSWLGARGVSCVAISLSDLFWEILEQSGYLETVFDEEQRNPSGVAFVNTALRELMAGPPSLADRVLDRLQGLASDAVVFLYRAGALYPVYRTSALLDDLRERLLVPVVLLYPGTLVGRYGLSFMGRLEPAHGYRAKIVVRGECDHEDSGHLPESG